MESGPDFRKFVSMHPVTRRLVLGLTAASFRPRSRVPGPSTIASMSTKLENLTTRGPCGSARLAGSAAPSARRPCAFPHRLRRRACGYVIRSPIDHPALAPVLPPAALKRRIERVHSGPIMVMNVMVGLPTPPVGMARCVPACVGTVPFEEGVRARAPRPTRLLLIVVPVAFVPATVSGTARAFKELA
jgi:Tripartite ATP-independent periplasmic transporter, DctM component